MGPCWCLPQEVRLCIHDMDGAQIRPQTIIHDMDGARRGSSCAASAAGSMISWNGCCGRGGKHNFNFEAPVTVTKFQVTGSREVVIAIVLK